MKIIKKNLQKLKILKSENNKKKITKT
jgi:hypothetical protein